MSQGGQELTDEKWKVFGRREQSGEGILASITLFISKMK
jgi:hypothetical protein